MFPAIFLDRDGVLMENRADYIRDWSHVHIFADAIKAISNYNLMNHKLVIVTNQSVVGRGLISSEIIHDINNRLVTIVRDSGGQIAGVYTCLHKPEDECNCRKPKPGLLLQAASDLKIDLARSWMIGDAWSDLLAGQAAGVKGLVILKTGRGHEQLLQPPPDGLTDYYIFNDLADALFEIQKLENQLSTKE